MITYCKDIIVFILQLSQFCPAFFYMISVYENAFEKSYFSMKH